MSDSVPLSSGRITKLLDALNSNRDEKTTRDAMNLLVKYILEVMSTQANQKVKGAETPVPADGDDTLQEAMLELWDLFNKGSKWVHDTAVNRKGLEIVIRTLSQRKVCQFMARERVKKRGSGLVRREADLPEGGIVFSHDDSPVTNIDLKEMVARNEGLLRAAVAHRRKSPGQTKSYLGDQMVQIYHLWRAGYETRDIELICGITPKTAERRVQLVIDVIGGDLGLCPPATVPAE